MPFPGDCLRRFVRAAKRTRIGSNRRRARPRSNRDAAQVHNDSRPRYTTSNLWVLPSRSPLSVCRCLPKRALVERKISAARRQDPALARSLRLRNGEVSDALNQVAPSSDSATSETVCSRHQPVTLSKRVVKPRCGFFMIAWRGSISQCHPDCAARLRSIRSASASRSSAERKRPSQIAGFSARSANPRYQKANCRSVSGFFRFLDFARSPRFSAHLVYGQSPSVGVRNLPSPVIAPRGERSVVRVGKWQLQGECAQQVRQSQRV
jgi:hypothetical protein